MTPFKKQHTICHDNSVNTLCFFFFFSFSASTLFGYQHNIIPIPLIHYVFYNQIKNFNILPFPLIQKYCVQPRNIDLPNVCQMFAKCLPNVCMTQTQLDPINYMLTIYNMRRLAYDPFQETIYNMPRQFR